MPSSAQDRLKTWTDRLAQADKLYDKWSKKYDTARLEKYYLGEQWRGLPEEDANKRYVINLFYATVETNKPSLAHYRPRIRIQPRPGRGDTLGSNAKARARLCEDTVQTFIDDPDIDFPGSTSLALHEAHFRFGVVEVGYSADWIDNPNAGKPVLKEDGETPVVDSDDKPILGPDRIPDNETLFVRRIPASQFRCSISSKNRLQTNDWVAYYEWHYVEDIKRNKAYSNTAQLKATGVVRRDAREDGSEFSDDIERRHGMVKLWKVWDIRNRVRHVIADGHKKFLQEDEPASFVPLAVLKFHEILDSFYPMPLVYNWMGPQDELNETRDAQRAHRRRFYRRYTYSDGAITPPELEKLENGGDGVYALATSPPGVSPLTPVPDAPMGSDVWQHLGETKVDFLQVSGVSGDQRGVAESETATQANIIETRSRLREASSRTKVSDWLAAIARLILLTAKERMALPFWVKRNVDPFADPSEVESKAAIWKQIKSDDLGSTDLDIFVELASMSPITEEMERNSWNNVLALLTNPGLVMILAQSEPILRKTMALYGIRSENEIKEIQKVAMGVVQMMQQQAAAEAAAKAKLPATAQAAAGSAAATNGAEETIPPEIAQLIAAMGQGPEAGGPQ